MSLCVVVDEVMDSRFPADDSKLVFSVACELWVHSHIGEDLEYPRRILNKNKTISGQSTRESRSGYVKLSTLYIVGKQTLSTAWNVSNCVVKITVSK